MAKPVKPTENTAKKILTPRKPNSARIAKLIIQRRTLALLVVFGILAFAALFVRVYDLTITQHNELQDGASTQQMRSTVITASRGLRSPRPRTRCSSTRTLSRNTPMNWIKPGRRR